MELYPTGGVGVVVPRFVVVVPLCREVVGDRGLDGNTMNSTIFDVQVLRSILDRVRI